MAERRLKDSGMGTGLVRGAAWKNPLEYSDAFQPCTDWKNPHEIHTTPELLEGLRRNPSWEVEGNALAFNETNKGKLELGHVKVDRNLLLEKKKSRRQFKEFDAFGSDAELNNRSSRFVGDSDFVPLLGGPFYKQLYYYDYLRMHALSFHAYHHDPLARRIVSIMRDFTLGRGWRMDFDGPDKKKAKALWEAFEKVNNLYDLMDSLAREMSIYGEVMIWKLPDNATKIGYDLPPEQAVERGIIPRIRLIDPSVIWEIVTFPEDISRVLYYQWVAPTQYQIYTGSSGGKPVPTTKFIFQQIPAAEVMHYKINSVSNEKRGRSDLFPVLGYLKYLRDSVSYSVIAMQKATAWSIDTTIDGSSGDVQRYVDEQMALGTIPNAGGEFVHTSKVERDYLSNEASAKGNQSTSFDWCMSMAAIGTGIPVSYFGSHLSAAGTRASALISSEPVAKVFEMRQLKYRQILKDLASWVICDVFGLDATPEPTFPENITQDRTAKMRDLGFAQAQGWISPKRAGIIAAQELEIDEYEWEAEQNDIEDQADEYPSPLTAPSTAGDIEGAPKSSAITAPERRKIANNDRNL